MNRITFILLLMFVCLAARCQPPVTKVEFTTLTRGYQKQIFITADSVIAITDGRQDDNQVSKRRTDPAEWQLLMDALRGVDPQEISGLQSPTSRRAFDGARHSTIKLIVHDGKEYQHGFDDEFPHDKLKPLMDAIVKTEKNFERK
ncbi:MAG TPA: hypothetical protein VEB86_17085 [Chryseosolibacter sp.]|nr:hypothetical protein [Chryseosolibacter sp.]